MSQTPFNEWTTEDITNWITDKLPGSGVLKQKACEAIRENELTGSDLMDLTDKSMLKDINIPALFANKLWSGIKELQKTVRRPTSVPNPTEADAPNDMNQMSAEETAARTERSSAIEDRLAQLLAQNNANLKNRAASGSSGNGSAANASGGAAAAAAAANGGFRVQMYVGMRLKKTRNLLYPHSTVWDLKQEIANTESGGDPSDLALTCNSRPLTDSRSLEQSGVDARSTVRAVFRVHGGSSAASEAVEVSDEKESQLVVKLGANDANDTNDANDRNEKKKGYFDDKAAIRRRLPRFDEKSKIKPTLAEDCVMGPGDQNMLNVEMPCGHAFEPMTIFKICQSAMRVHTKTEVMCPLTDCAQKWDMYDIVCAADLDENEHANLMRVLENRKLLTDGNFKECPGCEDLVEKPDEQYMLRVHCGSPECTGKPDFCWVCAKSWVSDGMAVCGNKDCPTATVNESLKIENCGATKAVLSRDDVECPKLRACPHCLTLVQYKDACKHMRCWSCQEYFCFICLSVAKKDENGYPKEWGCEYGDSHSGQCKLAPVQQVF